MQIRKGMFESKMRNFAFKMMDFVLGMMNFAFKMMDFVRPHQLRRT